jgi:hypothetical protein
MLKVKLNCISDKELFNRYVSTPLTVFFQVFYLKGLSNLQNRTSYHGATAPSGPRSPHYQGFMITLSYTRHSR